MSACADLRRAKGFSVFVVWASLVISYMQYGAIIPLLPIYVQKFMGIKLEATVRSNFTDSTTSSVVSTNLINTPKGKESVIIGSLLGISKLAQLVISPAVGITIDKIGYDIPLFIGYALQIGAGLGFSFAEGEALLFVMRIIQGIGAAFINTAGLTIVADLYRDDDAARGKMISYAVCGISIGLMVGPPFGSAMYQFGKNLATFMTIAAMMLCVALMQLCIRIPRVNPIEGGTRQATPMKTQLILLTDPYVVICLIMMIFGMSGIAFLETTLPNHMLHAMHSDKWMLGMVFLPLNIGLAVGNPIQSWLTRKVGRWTVAFYSYLLSAGPYIAYPFCRNFTELLLPGFPLGFMISARVAAVLPALAYLVHTRYGPWAYGGAYALADMAISISFSAGPLLAGLLVSAIGFDGLMFLSAALSVGALIPFPFLRKPLAEENSSEESLILSENKPKTCINHHQEER